VDPFATRSFGLGAVGGSACGDGLAPSQAEEKLFLPLVARRVVTNPDYTIRQRFGIGVAPSWPGESSFPGLLSDFPNVEQLGFGWHTDWSYRTYPEQPQGIEFVQLVSVWAESSLQAGCGPCGWQTQSWP